MSAVLAHVVGVDHVTRNGIAPGVLGHVVVECGVRNDNVTQLGEHLAANLDNIGLGIVVQRGKRCNLTDPAEGLVGNDLGLGEVPATLNDAVADALDRLVDGLENIEDMLDGRLVIGQGNLQGVLLAILGVADEGTVDADALAVTLGKNLAGRRVEQLILEARAACVHNKNVHESPIFKILSSVSRTHPRHNGAHDTPETASAWAKYATLQGIYNQIRR